MKSILYVRVSSKEQAKEGFSIPAQRNLLREYARNNKITVVQEFEDVETAKKAGRREFGNMVKYLQSNVDVRAILVEKTDRLYRNFKDYALLEELDVELHLVKENEIISKSSRSHAKFIHGIKVLMAKNFIDNLSEEVKKGLREKVERGDWPHQAPLGYINNKSTRLVNIDVNKGQLIKRLFELYSTGEYSLSEVREKISAEGLTSRTGKKLSKSMVDSILKNPFYIGEFIWDSERYIGNHQPIVTSELFNKVRSVRESNSKPKTKKTKFPFRGLLTCARCGCAITAEIKKKKYVYYHCTGGRGKCNQQYVREETLDEAFSNVVKEVKIDSTIVHWIVKALKDSHKDEKLFRQGELTRLQKRSSSIQNKLDSAYVDKIEGTIDITYWKTVSEKWRSEQDIVNLEIEKFQQADRNYVDKGTQILELAKNAYSLYQKQDFEEKRKLLKCLLSNCTLDGLTIYPTYNKPFDLIANGLRSRTKYPRQDSNLLPSA